MGEYLKLKIEECARLISQETDWEKHERLVGQKEAYQHALEMFEEFERCGLV